MIPILLFFGLCFWGFGDCEPEEKELIFIDYLEYEQNFMFYLSDIDKTKKLSASTDDGITVYGKYTKGILVEKNDQKIFQIDFWQITTEINHNYLNSKALSAYRGITPTGSCLNSGAVCFDTQTNVLYEITELVDGINIDTELVVLQNSRVYDSERLDDDTVIVLMFTDDIMPLLERDHHFVPMTTMFFTMLVDDDKLCILDDDVRNCLQDLEIKNHEKRIAELETEVMKK